MSTNRLTAMMIDDFQHDPVLAARCIFGIELPPHQQIRLWSMWTHTFCIDCSGFGMGKTFTIALCCALRMILFENRTAGILGKTYAQGKLVYAYFDQWISECPIFRAEIRKNRAGEPMSVHGHDLCVITARNGNMCRVIPPDFNRDAERVASESWTDGYFDEWTRFRNYAAFDKVIIGRVRKPIKQPDNKRDFIFGNHIFCAGTAQYKWHPAYARVQHALDQIALGNPSYDYLSFNYTHIPEKYAWLESTDIARESMMATMRADEIRTEIMGEWMDDSVGFYNAKAVNQIRVMMEQDVIAL